MSMDTGTEVPETPKQLSKAGSDLDDRFGAAGLVRTLLRKVFPDHWSFLLGEIALYTFIILIITGIFLTLFFQPSMTDVVYHGSYTKLDGSKMSEAYASTLNLSFDVRGGLLMRQIHHWAADVFLAAIMAHLLRIFFTGAYRKPRDTNWLIGIGMLTIGIFEGFLGYSLPDDLLSGTGIRIAEGILLSIPIVGTYLTFFLFGGQYPGNIFIERFYMIHVLLLPGLLLALITAHMFIMVWQKHTQMPGKGRTERNVVGAPMYPYFMIKTGAFFFFVFGMIAALAAVVQINPIWLYGPYTPVSISSDAQPDFYMGWLEGGLRMFPNWVTNVGGFTIAWNAFIPGIVILGVLMTGLALWPMIERWATGDYRVHNVCDRPRNAPTRTAIGMGGVAFYGVLWLEGGNDVIANRFQIPLYETTEIARYAIFIAPIVVYFVTRRICLGLQRKDAELLTHGVEMGIIRQTPEGAYVEPERPLDEEERAAIIANPPPERLPAPETADANGVVVPAVRSVAGRVRSRVNAIFAEGIVLNGRTNGHGAHGNGHEAHGEGGPAAVGAGSGEPPAEGGDSGGVDGPAGRTPPPGDPGGA